MWFRYEKIKMPDIQWKFVPFNKFLNNSYEQPILKRKKGLVPAQELDKCCKLKKISLLAYFPLRILHATWNCPLKKTKQFNKQNDPISKNKLQQLIKKLIGTYNFTKSFWCIVIWIHNDLVLVRQKLRNCNNMSLLAYFQLRIFRATWNCPK